MVYISPVVTINLEATTTQLIKRIPKLNIKDYFCSVRRFVSRQVNFFTKLRQPNCTIVFFKHNSICDYFYFQNHYTPVLRKEVFRHHNLVKRDLIIWDNVITEVTTPQLVLVLHLVPPHRFLRLIVGHTNDRQLDDKPTFEDGSSDNPYPTTIHRLLNIVKLINLDLIVDWVDRLGRLSERNDLSHLPIKTLRL